MTPRVNNIVAAFALDVADAVTDATARAAGQSGALAAAVVALQQDPDCGVEQLRGVLGLSQPATVRLANQLVEAGLATRSRDEGDARRVRLRLTAAGQGRASEILTAREAAVAGFLNRLPAADQRALVDAISRIYAVRRPGHVEAEHICRLCDLAACPQRTCPVDRAVRLAAETLGAET